MKELRMFIAAMALLISIPVLSLTARAEDTWGQRVLVTAHRGDSSRYPENTIPAFEAAIKAGSESSRQELEALALRVASGEIKYCPHGRPVAVTLTKKELDKAFKRL